MISLPRNSALALGLAFMLGGCADYMNNRDTVSLGAGDAVEANLGISTIDPFPAAAKNTNIRIDGRKVKQAHDRYLEECDPEVVKCSTGSAPGISIVNNMPGAGENK